MRLAAYVVGILLLGAGLAHAQSSPPIGPSGATTITTGGTAQVLFQAGEVMHGCFIYNPLSATQQNIATAESLFVDFTGATPTTTLGTTQEILPGVAFPCPGNLGGRSTIQILGATTSHAFKVYQW